MSQKHVYEPPYIITLLIRSMSGSTGLKKIKIPGPATAFTLRVFWATAGRREAPSP